MAKLRFRAPVRPTEAGGSAFIELEAGAASRLSARARTPVRGTVKGAPFRSSIFPRGDGRFYMVLNRHLRAAGDISAGDVVDVVMERDEAPREVELPADLGKAIRRSRDAKAAWESFPYSHRKQYVDWVTEAKREEPRKRRVEKAVAMMAAKKPLR